MTLLSLWCLLPSPLMVGAEPAGQRRLDAGLADQPRSSGRQSRRGSAAAGQARRLLPKATIWKSGPKNSPTVRLAVGLFNRGDFPETVSADWKALGVSGRWAVRDLWQRRDLGAFSDKYAASVPPHGAVLLRLRR